MTTQSPASIATIDCDIAVFGSGAAGLTAAVVAAHEGLRVALFEKAPRLGGTTATSGGAVWIPDNHLARKAGVTDSRSAARALLAQQSGPSFRPDLVDAYLEAAPEAIADLEQHTDIRFDYVPAPDYVTGEAGAIDQGRCLAPVAFDGRQLGEAFEWIEPPRPAFMILGGLMVGRKEIPQFLHPFSSWTNIRAVTRLLARHARDRLRHSRGTRLLLGNALVARALHSARRLGVDIHRNARLQVLECEGGRVVGATVRTPAGQIRVRARRGLMLATGGFAHSPAWRQRLAPDHPHRLSLASPGNVGDAATAAVAVGAALDDALQSPGFWTPASVALDPHGQEIVFPYGHLDRGKPGAILVGTSGRRFVNESDSYHHVVLGMFGAGACTPRGRAFLVCDDAFIRRYGLGLVKPAPVPKRSFLRSGYLHRAGSAEALARELGIDPAGLADEIGRHNGFARSGHDPDFRKGETVFNRFNGDARGQPNPCLLPIDRPPFYAIEVFPCTLGTAAGLLSDGDGRVLGNDREPIPGLYVGGNDMGSVFRGAYPGPGITIGPAIVFAWRAMKHAARPLENP